MAWILTIWSSSSCCTSSISARMYVPVSRYGLQVKLISSHSPSMLTSAFSRENSLTAVMHVSSICAA